MRFNRTAHTLSRGESHITLRIQQAQTTTPKVAKMQLPKLIYSLATLTIATAVPLAPGNSVTAPTTTAAIMAPSLVSPVAVPSMTPVGAYQCPPKQFKRCCLSVQQTSRMLIDSIGKLVPALGGIGISSQVSFDCMFALSDYLIRISLAIPMLTPIFILLGQPMADNVSPNECNTEPYAPMCCNTEGGVCCSQSITPNVFNV